MNALIWSVSDTLVVTDRNLRKIPRVPEQLAFIILQPVLFVLLFRFVLGGAIHVGTASYADYLMPAVFVQTVSLGSALTCIGVAEDRKSGFIDRLRSLRMARSAVLAGRSVADLCRNAVSVVIMLLIGLAIGFRPHGGPLRFAAAFGLLLFVGFAFSWIGAFIGLLMRTAEAAQAAGMSWVFPLTFLSSAFVPTSSMPGWLQAFAAHQPITMIINAERGLLLGTGVGWSGWAAVLWCTGITVVFASLAVARYQRAIN